MTKDFIFIYQNAKVMLFEALLECNPKIQPPYNLKHGNESDNRSNILTIVMILLCHLTSTICGTTTKDIGDLFLIVFVAFLRHHMIHKPCLLNTK